MIIFFFSGKIWAQSGYCILERQAVVPLKFCCCYLFYKILKKDQNRNNLEKQSSRLCCAVSKTQPEQRALKLNAEGWKDWYLA